MGRWRRASPATQDVAEEGAPKTRLQAEQTQTLDQLSKEEEKTKTEVYGIKRSGDLRGGLHQDPKTGEWMQGPGIVDWGLEPFARFDGEEGRHHDPWGPGEIQKAEKQQGPRRKNVVRQGQGIEEALSRIGAEAGVRQERPRGPGYCPAGEAAFQAREENWTSESVRQKEQMGTFDDDCTDDAKHFVVSEIQTAAQLRNQRRARRRARHHVESLDTSAGGCVVLVRDDCRLHDNPALYAAAKHHPWVVPLYIHDSSDPSPLPVRGAALYWRHMSLACYGKALRACNGRLIFRRGQYLEELLDVLLSCSATSVYFNRQLEPWYHQRDLDIERKLSDLGFLVRSFRGLVLQREPWDLQEARPPPDMLTKYQSPPAKTERDDSDDPYFRPLQQPTADSEIEAPLPVVTRLGNSSSVAPEVDSLSLEELGYGHTAGRKMPRGSSMCQYNEERELRIDQGSLKRDLENDWAFELRQFWQFGEKGGLLQLEAFLGEAAAGHYQPPERYRADKPWTALLSPYLRFGDLSPKYVYLRARQVLHYLHWKPLVRRLFWRDGAYAQLYRWPQSPELSIRKQYENQEWQGTRKMLHRWQHGRTGFPLIDAAMRQLWKVGWMPNYLRHVTAQFLIEYLDVSWKQGLQWFDYTLVDSDVAINAMMWQMGGHSGLGAWNFVMHPVFAAKKVDPEGHYVRRWLPELKSLPVEYIHCPWEAPCACLLSANVLLSVSYPEQVIGDLLKARKAHARHVIAVRQSCPELVQPDGHEILEVEGQQLSVRVRDDLKDNSEEISLEMTADEAHSAQRRRLLHTKGVHHELLYEEAKRYEVMHEIHDGL